MGCFHISYYLISHPDFGFHYKFTEPFRCDTGLNQEEHRQNFEEKMRLLAVQIFRVTYCQGKSIKGNVVLNFIHFDKYLVLLLTKMKLDRRGFNFKKLGPGLGFYISLK